jgi:hypothetical protein
MFRPDIVEFPAFLTVGITSGILMLNDNQIPASFFDYRFVDKVQHPGACLFAEIAFETDWLKGHGLGGSGNGIQ